ncbi:T9SS type A sorting domain-containing protein [bacterium]|nr:T9SS type A sorting domain-containing protein [bacterium]
MKRHVHAFAALILAALFLAVTPAAAEVTFSPDSLDFGEIQVRKAYFLSFTLTNTGTDSVVLVKMNSGLDLPYYTTSVSLDTVRLAPGEARQVRLRLFPYVKMSVAGFRLSYQYLGANYPALTIMSYYRAVGGDLGCSWLLFRSLRERLVRVLGSRVADLQNTEVRITPPDDLTLRKISADQSEMALGITVAPEAALGVRWMLFESGGVVLDSLLVEVRRSDPDYFPSKDSLLFGPQKSLDTLTVRGRDLWPGCRFEFSLPELSLVSTELLPDSLARLVLRLDQSVTDTVSGMHVENPDSGAMYSQIFIRWNADALPLEPESGAPGAALPRAFSLGANVPNPFNPSTTIAYSVGGEAPVTVHLSVFNLRGQTVATLVDRVVAPGQYTVNWDGRGRGGEKLSSGVYFYRITAGDFSFTRKMVLLK